MTVMTRDEVREYTRAATWEARLAYDPAPGAVNLADRWLEDRDEAVADALNRAVARVHGEMDGHFSYATIHAIVSAVRGVAPRSVNEEDDA